MSFIRSYYLFLYYKIAMINKLKDGEPDTVKAYISIAMLYNAIPVIYLLFLLKQLNAAFINEFYDLLTIPIAETHEGLLTGMALLAWGIGLIATYFLCCYKINFEEIPTRIAKVESLKDEATWKAVIPMVIIAITPLLFVLFR